MVAADAAEGSRCKAYVRPGQMVQMMHESNTMVCKPVAVLAQAAGSCLKAVHAAFWRRGCQAMMSVTHGRVHAHKFCHFKGGTRLIYPVDMCTIFPRQAGTV